MSILVKGIDMPKNCADCHVACQHYLKLGLDGLIAKICYSESRRADCPLIEVPPHGRLIDADALTYMMGMDEYFSPLEAIYIMGRVSDAPTIVQAESITAEEEKNDKQGTV